MLLRFAQSLCRSFALLSCFVAPSLCSVALTLLRFAQSLCRSFALLSRFDAPSLCSVALSLLRFAQSLAIQWFHHIEKLRWYPPCILQPKENSLTKIPKYSNSKKIQQKIPKKIPTQKFLHIGKLRSYPHAYYY